MIRTSSLVISPSLRATNIKISVKAKSSWRCAAKKDYEIAKQRWVLWILAFLLLTTRAFAQSPPPLTFPTWQPVGSTSAPAVVTVGSKSAGKVSSVQVLTVGTAGLEFADAGGACTSASFTGAGQPCTESVTFTPKSAGIQLGAIVLLDSNSAVIGTAYLSAVGQAGLGILSPGEIVTFAGSGAWKTVQDGPALSATLYLPTSIALDAVGNMYIADSLHNRIRKVDTTQTMSTVAGGDAASYTGDGGPAASATLNTPSGVALDGAGNLFIADTANNVVREILNGTGIIVTVAGNGTQGNTGDGGPATAAELNQPLGVTVDIAGNLFIADTGNNRIRRVDVYTGEITNFAGSPDGAPGYSGDGGSQTVAHLNGPNAVAFDLAGNMYIPDSLNNVIREVYATGGIGTFAGGGTTPIQFGPSATAAQLDTPSGVLVDAAQNVYIADTQNEAIRKVFAVSGYFTTVSKLGETAGYFDGTNYEQGLYGPEGFARDSNGNIFIADVFNNKIREMQSNKMILDFTFDPTYVGDISQSQPQYLENDGNAPLTLTSITPDANAAIDNTVQNSCVTGSPGYGPVAGCVVSVEFTPTTTGDPLEAHVSVATDSGGNSPLDIELAGKAIPASPTAITLTSTPNPSNFEQSVTFEATVAATPPAGSTTTTNLGTPTGTVTFLSDGAGIGTATLDSTGRATLNYAGLTVGTHAITASYAGTNDYLAGTSSAVSQVVQKMPTSTSLGASSAGGANSPATLVATVTGITSVAPVPTGTVTFFSGTTNLGTATLNANGVATLNPQLAATSNTFTATYSGDAVHSPSTSVAVSITIVPVDFTMSAAPTAITVAAGQYALVNVTISSNDGYADTVGLGCASLPANVNCHFATDTIALAANGSQTVQLTIDTNNPLGGGSSAMNSFTGNRGFALAGIFLPGGLVFGCIFWRARKRNRAVFSAVLALLLSSAILVSGCSGGFSQSRATPGTYVMQVTGIGVKSNFSNYQNVTLTITK
jgi:sugar lactone lactonase YvrE